MHGQMNCWHALPYGNAVEIKRLSSIPGMLTHLILCQIKHSKGRQALDWATEQDDSSVFQLVFSQVQLLQPGLASKGGCQLLGAI